MTEKLKLNDEVLDLVSGGKVYINGETVLTMSVITDGDTIKTSVLTTAGSTYSMTMPSSGEGHYESWQSELRSKVYNRDDHMTLDGMGFELKGKQDMPHIQF